MIVVVVLFSPLLQDQRQSKRKSTQGTHPHMLVVCPATVLQHWLSEFHHWAPRLRVVILHSISDCYLQLQSLGGRGVHRALHKISKSGDERNRRRKVNGESSEVSSEIDVHCGVVCITTYEGLRRLAPEVFRKLQHSVIATICTCLFTLYNPLPHSLPSHLSPLTCYS